MKKSFTVFTLILLIFVPYGVSDAGDFIEDFTFKTIDGKTFDTSELKGTPMVINIMAHWCVPCRKESQEVQKAYLYYRDKGVLFLGVFVKGGEDDIRRFAKTYHLSFPVGMDNNIARQFGARTVPTTAFVGKDKRIVRKYFGPVDYSRIQMGIEEILGQ